jgi:hypothetical protein
MRAMFVASPLAVRWRLAIASGDWRTSERVAAMAPVFLVGWAVLLFAAPIVCACAALASPWLHVYDLTILALPLAWLVTVGAAHRFSPIGEGGRVRGLHVPALLASGDGLGPPARHAGVAGGAAGSRVASVRGG